MPGYLRAAYSALSRSQDDVKAAESKGVADLEKEARKQEIVMEFQAHQARVSQELAIAERISASAEVEIEEYYDLTGKGHVGVRGGGGVHLSWARRRRAPRYEAGDPVRWLATNGPGR